MTRRAEFSEAEAQAIVAIAEAEGWQVAAHDVMRPLSHNAYRLAVDAYRGQLRALLPLTPESKVLQLRCGWGPVALSLAAVAMVTALDDRPAPLRFAAARGRQEGAASLHAVRASPEAPLPFAGGSFDAALLLDALEVAAGRAQLRLLREVWRALRPGGWLLLGATNRIGLARAPGAGRQRSRTFWGYAGLLRHAGFGELSFHAPLPSQHEPFWILPLAGPRQLEFFVERLFTAQDLRPKLAARGLGAAYTPGVAAWHLGRLVRLTGLARYLVPAYLILARK